jgi:hypothetical protein
MSPTTNVMEMTARNVKFLLVAIVEVHENSEHYTCCERTQRKENLVGTHRHTQNRRQ